MMAYGKKMSMGGKGSASPVGIFSHKSNPMPQPKRVETKFGPNSNADAMKAQRLLKQQHSMNESLRGKSGC